MSQTTANYRTTQMLSRIYRSQMPQTTAANNYRTSQMLSRIYRSQMSQTTTNNRTTQLLPRICRS